MNDDVTGRSVLAGNFKVLRDLRTLHASQQKASYCFNNPIEEAPDAVVVARSRSLRGTGRRSTATGAAPRGQNAAVKARRIAPPTRIATHRLRVIVPLIYWDRGTIPARGASQP